MIIAPEITVLMPVYNAERFIEDAINSILGQTFDNFELLLICEPCSDNTIKLVNRYKDSRIRFIYNSKKLGLAKSLNKGLKLAKGEYIARMDADDVAYPRRLELQYAAFNKEKEAILVSTFYNEVDGNRNYIRTVKEGFTPEELYYNLNFINCIGHSTVMFDKHKIINKFKGYDEKKWTEDYELWLRVSKKYKIIKLRKVLMDIRYFNLNRTNQNINITNRSALDISQVNLQQLIGEPVSQDITSILTLINPLKYKSPLIKNAIKVLENVNYKVELYCPSFLNKQLLSKSANNRKNWLKLYLLISTLFDSNFGFIFKAIYKFYLLFKKNNYNNSYK